MGRDWSPRGGTRCPGRPGYEGGLPISPSFFAERCPVELTWCPGVGRPDAARGEEDMPEPRLQSSTPPGRDPNEAVISLLGRFACAMIHSACERVQSCLRRMDSRPAARQCCTSNGPLLWRALRSGSIAPHSFWVEKCRPRGRKTRDQKRGRLPRGASMMGPIPLTIAGTA